MSKIYDFEATSIDGNVIKLKEYAGKTLLIVNTASACGFTVQYDGLEKLYERHKDEGLVVLGFPCNQFANQESGTSSEISSFCRKNFGVTFPIFSKVNVNGSDAHPLFEYLKKEKTGVLGTKSIKWNFTKFLIDKNGKVLRRYSPRDDPLSFEKDIEAVL
eukprot:NODE_408_length_9221_cov_0.216400.p6 type:complete len:160 gc:universal NODE_408_length_9221_cov_0.216400:5681-6160(+)